MNILRYRLSLDDKPAGLSPEKTVEEYKRHYPGDEKWIDSFRKRALSVPVDVLNRLPGKRLFFENFPFFMETLRTANRNLDRHEN